MKSRFVSLLACIALPCAAQVAAPPAQEPPAAAAASPTPGHEGAPAGPPTAPASTGDPGAPRGGEPNVKHTVIDGKTTTIDELRVRGVAQRIVVTTKGAGTRYEIITGDGSRDLSPGANTSRGAAGQRVWRVLDF